MEWFGGGHDNLIVWRRLFLRVGLRFISLTKICGANGRIIFHIWGR